ncbi:MAG: hypothetical protein GY861_16340 [bacterium]|nr:hypothetical protein [bacterium]
MEFRKRIQKKLLFFGSRWGVNSLVAKALKMGADIHMGAFGDFRNDGPLSLAVRHYHVHTVRFLLERGANPNASFLPLLDIACRFSERRCKTVKEIIELLLEYGADVNQTEENLNALVALTKELEKIKRGKAKGIIYELVQLLIAKGSNVNGQCDWKETPLRHVSKDGSVNIVSLLISSGADVNARDDWGDTPLYVAVEARNNNIVKLLLDAGANPNSKTKKYKVTPLYCAVEDGNNDVVRLLIDAGADVNARVEGKAPLHEATENGNLEAVILLVNGGANINTKTKYNETPLSLAEGYYDDITEILKSQGGKSSQFRISNKKSKEPSISEEHIASSTMQETTILDPEVGPGQFHKDIYSVLEKLSISTSTEIQEQTKWYWDNPQCYAFPEPGKHDVISIKDATSLAVKRWYQGSQYRLSEKELNIYHKTETSSSGNEKGVVFLKTESNRIAVIPYSKDWN